MSRPEQLREKALVERAREAEARRDKENAAPAARTCKFCGKEQQAIAQAAYADYSGHLWIGINDRIEEGTFAWTDGSPVDFEHWAGNEPNDWGSGEDCGHLYEGGENRWNDLPCGHQAGYLCRVPNLSLP